MEDRMANGPQNQLGCGWKFPVQFECVSGKPKAAQVMMSRDADNIKESLQVLFSTQPYERVMRAGYGCDLQAFVFENISDGLRTEIRQMISDAVQTYEPRGTLVSIDFRPDSNSPWTLNIDIAYRIPLNNTVQHVGGRLNFGSPQGGWLAQ
ncbi:Baseplate assembly protein W [Mycetohabitans rhizoxinica HKI 454]|uniref:Baseplate assembly protein W n=2 Tax=Mycetohabitans rhizoxinica TaxID=412963 RepID=E5AT04_MYCRK|nr:Baseplate assembly protein W [Mycetohabitans rhizoxinica HKI 454]